MIFITLLDLSLPLNILQWVFWEVMQLPSVSVHNHFFCYYYLSHIWIQSEAHYPLHCSPSLILVHRKNSGFGNIDPNTHELREDGWVKNADDYVLSNEYYHSLVDPEWHQQFIDNVNTKVITTIEDFGEVRETTMAEFGVIDRIQWYIDPTMENVVMTGSDIALAKDCKGNLITDKYGVEGLCLCLFSELGEIDEEMDARIPEGFSTQGICPDAVSTLPFVNTYLYDNKLFHDDFAAMMDIMVCAGYVFH